jgi:hypothetical protein
MKKKKEKPKPRLPDILPRQIEDRLPLNFWFSRGKARSGIVASTAKSRFHRTRHFRCAEYYKPISKILSKLP